MESQRLGDYIVCNPTVKLKKGQQCQLTDIDSITIGQKYPISKGLVIYDGQSGSKFSKGDTIMARITPCLENGKIAMYNGEEDSIGSTELFVFRGKEGVSTNEFVYYFFKQDWIRNYAANSMTGASGRQRADIKFIQKAKVQFPPLATQQKVASILSAYDSQIENNQKRIKLLEQMAENLYKEWFVRFRFPGYESAEFKDGTPIGWKDLQAQDVFNITIGRTPSRKVFEFFSTERENNCSWISISDMKNGMFIKDTSEYLTPEALKACNMPMVKANTVLLSFKLTVGKVAISLEETSTNEAIAHFNTDDHTLKEYTYLYLKCFNYSKLGNTSAIGNAINSTIVKNMSFILPSKDIILEFHKQAKPLFDGILNLTQQISSLTHQRDLLLPRLMSGKLSI